ncbi:AN1-type zinc finger protein 5-like [Grus japonensis]|uniref:AN1-type zinc finger protein 5-like n=1 Tax=Grus japonensis TaxID=30415 RepID=A0ABC9WL31_GRUJA
MVRQAVPPQPVEADGGADIHLQPMEDPTPEQVDAPEGGCDPVGSPHWSKLLARPVDPWREEPRLEQSLRAVDFHIPDADWTEKSQRSSIDQRLAENFHYQEEPNFLAVRN